MSLALLVWLTKGRVRGHFESDFPTLPEPARRASGLTNVPGRSTTSFLEAANKPQSKPEPAFMIHEPNFPSLPLSRSTQQPHSLPLRSSASTLFPGRMTANGSMQRAWTNPSVSRDILLTDRSLSEPTTTSFTETDQSATLMSADTAKGKKKKVVLYRHGL